MLPASLESFGLWVEQLVAESTGKQGKGIVPIAGEHGDVTRADDRVVVDRDDSGAMRRRACTERSPRRSRMSVVTLDDADVQALGAEFFRWEVATATAGGCSTSIRSTSRTCSRRRTRPARCSTLHRAGYGCRSANPMRRSKGAFTLSDSARRRCA